MNNKSEILRKRSNNDEAGAAVTVTSKNNSFSASSSSSSLLNNVKGKNDNGKFLLLPRTKQDIEMNIITAQKLWYNNHNNVMKKWQMKLLIILCSIYLIFGIGFHIMLSKLSHDYKKRLGDRTSDVWKQFEKWGLYEKNPTLFMNSTLYNPRYPNLHILDNNYEIIKEETIELLKMKDELGGLHKLGKFFKNDKPGKEQEWKQFMIKIGSMIEENRQWMPKTYDLVKQVPEVVNLYISILEPHYSVRPHWKYYKGFVKYHSALIIPNNNVDYSSFLRVDETIEPTQKNLDLNHIRAIKPNPETSPKYYWKSGVGVVWDDMLYHEAINNSDETRVLLIADVARNMPWYLHYINRFFIWLAYQDPDVQEMKHRAIFKGAWEDHEDIVTGF